MSTDHNGRTPLRLALSRLRIMKDSDKEEEEEEEDDPVHIGTCSQTLQTRKKEIEQVRVHGT